LMLANTCRPMLIVILYITKNINIFDDNFVLHVHSLCHYLEGTNDALCHKLRSVHCTVMLSYLVGLSFADSGLSAKLLPRVYSCCYIPEPL
jgi:hypothetical protein